MSSYYNRAQAISLLSAKADKVGSDDIEFTSAAVGIIGREADSDRVRMRAVMDPPVLTIDSGEITITHDFHAVNGEGDASDDLATVNGYTTLGDFVLIKPHDDANDITIKHGTGNIEMDTEADYQIPDGEMVLLTLGLGGITGTAIADWDAFDATGLELDSKHITRYSEVVT